MLTVRLPDLTSPVVPRLERPERGAPPNESTSKDELALLDTEHSVTERAAPPQGILARFYHFVGQPKFWLACITAIGVQVVLALFFTPAPSSSGAASGQHKAVAAPKQAAPARIVVPPAKVSSPQGPTSTADHLMVPQMQPAPPPDAATQVEPLPSTSSAPVEGANAASSWLQERRLAERRSLAAERKYDGQATAEAIGATLEGVAPVDEVDLEQPNGGNR